MSSLRNLSQAESSRDQAVKKLASGKRINQAGDDAAGLAISSKIDALARSQGQSIRNAHDGISIVQVAEAGMNEVTNILIRFRELAIQAASDTISDTERGYLNREVSQLATEIDRTAETVTFNSRRLIDGGGSWPTLEVQIGVHDDKDKDRFMIERAGIDMKLESLGLWGINVSSKDEARNFLRPIDRAIQAVSARRAKLGALQNGLQSAAQNMVISRENQVASKSRILDTDFALETAEKAKGDMMADAASSVLVQANQLPAQVLALLNLPKTG